MVSDKFKPNPAWHSLAWPSQQPYGFPSAAGDRSESHASPCQADFGAVRACEIETRVRVHPNPSRNVRTRKVPPIYMISNVCKVLCVSGP